MPPGPCFGNEPIGPECCAPAAVMAPDRIKIVKMTRFMDGSFRRPGSVRAVTGLSRRLFLGFASAPAGIGSRYGNRQIGGGEKKRKRGARARRSRACAGAF